MDRKSDVLAFLKTGGSAGLAEIAAHLGISRQGALRHVDALAARGLVQVTTGPHEGPGRPGHVYRLSGEGEAQSPNGRRDLAGELVEFLDPEQVDRFFAARAGRLEAEYGPLLAGLGFQDRVQELARLAAEQGHMTEVAEGARGELQLRHCSCPIGEVAARTPLPCRHELDLYQRLLGAGVRRSTWAVAGDATCTYEINDTSAKG